MAARRDGVHVLASTVMRAMKDQWACQDSCVVGSVAQDLVDTPQDFQDYVVVHELLHLRYRSHGKAFTAMMTALVPAWRELEKVPGASHRSVG
ncbi:MAG: M48 metallopeptidase family protein [Candidatus Nanopelagicales bacterium]